MPFLLRLDGSDSEKTRRIRCLLGLALLMAGAISVPWARAQAHVTGQAEADTGLAEVRKAVAEAQKEIAAFRESGGKDDDPNHPAVKWLGLLWEYRQKYPGSDASSLATSEALHLLFHSGRIDEVLARVDTLSPDDGAWERLPNVLNELANQRNDQTLVVPRFESVANRTTRSSNRAAVLLGMGRALRNTDPVRARDLLDRAVSEAPGTPAAREADNLLYEIANLTIGRPAPAFSVKAWKGETVALEGYKNQALVIVFWAST